MLRGHAISGGSDFRRAMASRRWREPQARAVLAELEASRLEVLDFCRRYELDHQRIGFWQRRLGGVGDGGKSGLLVPVRVVGSSPVIDDEPIEIMVRGERTIRVRSGFDGETLRRVFEVLGC